LRRRLRGCRESLRAAYTRDPNDGPRSPGVASESLKSVPLVIIAVESSGFGFGGPTLHA